MKKLIAITLSILLTCSSLSARDEIADFQKNTEELYTTGCAATDGAFTAISASMIGWTIGILVTAVLLVALVNSSSSNDSN